MNDDELKDAVLLVFANKQDIKGCLTAGEITDSLKIQNLKQKKILVQACSAVSGDGLNQGLEWLTKNI
jgi:signal recognition particle receptor subunit beta